MPTLCILSIHHFASDQKHFDLKKLTFFPHPAPLNKHWKRCKELEKNTDFSNLIHQHVFLWSGDTNINKLEEYTHVVPSLLSIRILVQQGAWSSSTPFLGLGFPDFTWNNKENQGEGRGGAWGFFPSSVGISLAPVKTDLFSRFHSHSQFSYYQNTLNQNIHQDFKQELLPVIPHGSYMS